MTFFERYLQGETVAVYDEIYALKHAAFKPDYFSQVDLVLNETFKRVRYNLELIYNELRSINYQFVSNIKYEWEMPLLLPDANTDSLLSKLKRKVKSGGHVPLSLEYFYKIVGSCNFCWDWKTNPDIPWEGADPIDIPPINTLITELIYDDYDSNEILLSGDYLQKDNVSGSCYNIELTDLPSIDSLLIGWDIPFIEYLRLTFKNCGFTMADRCEYESLKIFCDKVKPQLQEI
ncbi:MAG: hypothetical protein ACTHMM_13780 [Agriterribacter sp.]